MAYLKTELKEFFNKLDEPIHIDKILSNFRVLPEKKVKKCLANMVHNKQLNKEVLSDGDYYLLKSKLREKTSDKAVKTPVSEENTKDSMSIENDTNTDDAMEQIGRKLKRGEIAIQAVHDIEGFMYDLSILLADTRRKLDELE